MCSSSNSVALPVSVTLRLLGTHSSFRSTYPKKKKQKKKKKRKKEMVRPKTTKQNKPNQKNKTK
jgi:hypothetical protein